MVAGLKVDIFEYKYQLQFNRSCRVYIGLEPVLFLSANWMLIGIHRSVSVIVILHLIFPHCEWVMAAGG